MKTLAELAHVLEEARQTQNLSYKTLASRVGLTPLALSQALKGKSALRANNLMALADELGLEMVLLPKVVAQSMQSSSSRSNLHRPHAHDLPGPTDSGDTWKHRNASSGGFLTSMDRVLERLRSTEPNSPIKRLQNNRGNAPLPNTNKPTASGIRELEHLQPTREAATTKASPAPKKPARASSK